MFETGTASRDSSRGGPPLLSLAMIVKDGGQLFTELLDEAGPWVDEMVIGDTGSSDGSDEVARGAGARVLNVPWQDDFSAARNTVLEACRGRWILVLDADEKLAAADWQALRAWVQKQAGNRARLAGRLITRNYLLDRHADRSWEETPQPDPHGLPCGPVAPGYVPSGKVRLFPRRPDVRFAGCLHETVEASLAAAGWQEVNLPWPVHHWGSLNVGRCKHEFYLGLARRKTEANPDQAQAWSELADVATQCGNFEEALDALDRSLVLEPARLERRLAFAWLLKETGRGQQAELQYKAVAGSPGASNRQLAEACHMQAQLALEADDAGLLARAGALLSLALRLHPDHGPQLNTLGVWHLRQGRGEEGRLALERAAALMPGDAEPLLNLAVLYHAANRPREAGDHVQQVLATDPENPRARDLARRWALL